MKTLADVTEPGALRSTPRLDRTAFRLLWDSDYWDGPLSGMLEASGNVFWFQCVQEDLEVAAGWFRRFAVIRLSPEQLADEYHWHDLFRRCVGTHTDYDAEGKRSGAVLPGEKWVEFYDAFRNRARPDYSACEVVGWFER